MTPHDSSTSRAYIALSRQLIVVGMLIALLFAIVGVAENLGG